MVIILTVVIIIFVVYSSYASFLFGYSMLKPYLKTAAGKAKVFRWALILFASGIALYIITMYSMRGPDYFEQGIDQLHNSSYINAKIGDFSSYSYNADSLVKHPESPTKFQVAINGDSTTFFLTCTMVKLNNAWKLTRIHQDSVINKRP